MSRARSVWLVARREIIERGRSRGYVVSLLITIALLGAGFGLPVLFSGDRDTLKVGVVDGTPASVQQAIAQLGTPYQVKLAFTSFADAASAEQALTDEKVDAIVAIPADFATAGTVKVREEADDRVRGVVVQGVSLARTNAYLAAHGIPPDQLATAAQPPQVVAQKPRSDEDRTAFIFANAGIIFMFIGIFSYGFWVLSGVVEEKQSRVVEVVLSTVRPRDLLMGKVLGIGVLGLGQLIVLVGAGLIVSQVTGRLTLPPTTLSAVAMLLLWFVLGYALYSTALGFLGALASRMEEASNASTPVTMVAMLSYFAAILLVTDQPAGLLGRILTFVPPSAPMVVPLRAALGAIEPWEIVLSVALTIVFIFALFVIGGRVYSGAVLQSGSRMKLRDAWRAAQ